MDFDDVSSKVNIEGLESSIINCVDSSVLIVLHITMNTMTFALSFGEFISLLAYIYLQNNEKNE